MVVEVVGSGISVAILDFEVGVIGFSKGGRGSLGLFDVHLAFVFVDFRARLAIND